MKTSRQSADKTRGFSKRLVLLVMLCLPAGLIAQENSHAIAVRNQVAQQESPVTTLRHWKISKGSFDRFLKVSQDGIWPYFEKIGARVVGMWVVLDVVPTAENLVEEIAVLVCGRLAQMESSFFLTHVRLYETPNCWADWDA